MRLQRFVQIFCIFAILVCSQSLWAQEYNPNPKNASDGMLTDWGNGLPFNPTNYEHLYDNEAQYLQNSTLYGLIPPGGPGDSPLAVSRVHPDGIPMGNGFNIISALVSFDCTVKGGTYWVSLDLPGPTNDLMSEGFYNTYVYDLTAGVEEWYPPPFDSDCNENKTTVDDIVSGGFGSIIATIEEQDLEFYRIWLWVAGDPDAVPEFIGSRVSDAGGTATDGERDVYDGPGFPIVISWSENINGFEPYQWSAFVPAIYRKNPPAGDLILGNSSGGGLGLVVESDPKNSVKPHYDVEMEISGIITHVYPEIDPVEAGPPGEPIEFWDIFHSFVRMKADTDGDFSAENELFVGIDVPRLPMLVEVEKTVFCGNCDEDPIPSYPAGQNEFAFALPGSDVLFVLDITIPRDHPQHPGNGLGYVYGNDLLVIENGNVKPGSLELCSDLIELNGQTGIIDVDGFNINGASDWVVVEKGTTDPYLFYPSDPNLVDDIQIKIPFKVTVGETFNIQGQTQDILNTVTVWGNNGLTNSPEDTDTAFVNIVIPEITCGKYLEVYEDGNPTAIAEGTDVEVDLQAGYLFPLTAKYTLTVTNTGETEVEFGQDALFDYCLCLIPDLGPIPFCNGNTNPPQSLGLNQSFEVEVAWVINDIDEYLAAAQIQKDDGNCDDGTHIWNEFIATGTAVVEGDIAGQPYYICNNGQNLIVTCESNVVVLEFIGIEAVIDVVKLVSCDDTNFSEKLVDALPGSAIYFQLTVSNPPTGPVDHDRTWFGDNLNGECTYADEFTIVTPGYSIDPPVFVPDGSTTYRILPPLEIGQSVVMTFRAEVDPDWDQMNTGPEIANTIGGFADGPDADELAEAADTDFANADIKIPEISCTKLVQVTTDFGGGNQKVYGPAQTIGNIPRTDGYPWKVEWGIIVSNDGETYLNATVSDPLIENYTGNDCNLPHYINLAPGAVHNIICTEIIEDYDENYLLDLNDPGGFDEWVNNWVTVSDITVDVDPPTGDPVCYLFNGQPVDAYTLDDIHCNAKYNAPPPCGEIEIVNKLVSCFENTGYATSVEAVPGAWVYYRFTLMNPSATVDLDHVWARDQLSGEYINFTPIDPPGFQINTSYPGYDLGGLDAGQTITVKYKVQVDPNYDTVGPPEEISNTLTVYADGPDLDEDPDPVNECPNAEATVTAGAVNAVIPELRCEKELYVKDDAGLYYPGGTGTPPPPVEEVSLPETVTYPIEIHYFLTVDNSGEVDLPEVDITDEVIQNLEAGIPPGIDIVCVPAAPQWDDNEILKGNSWLLNCVVTLDDYFEAELLGKNDKDPHISDTITNELSAIQESFDSEDFCGPTQGDLTDDCEGRVNLFPTQNGIPALDEVGIVLMILLLGGLLVWRTVRTG